MNDPIRASRDSQGQNALTAREIDPNPAEARWTVYDVLFRRADGTTTGRFVAASSEEEAVQRWQTWDEEPGAIATACVPLDMEAFGRWADARLRDPRYWLQIAKRQVADACRRALYESP